MLCRLRNSVVNVSTYDYSEWCMKFSSWSAKIQVTELDTPFLLDWKFNRPNALVNSKNALNNTELLSTHNNQS